MSITAHTLPKTGKTATSSACCWCLKTCVNKRSSRDLLNAQAVANIGTWQTHFDGAITLTPGGAAFGWPMTKPFTHAQFLTSIHEDDRVRVDAEWNAGLRLGRFRF